MAAPLSRLLWRSATSDLRPASWDQPPSSSTSKAAAVASCRLAFKLQSQLIKNACGLTLFRQFMGANVNAVVGKQELFAALWQLRSRVKGHLIEARRLQAGDPREISATELGPIKNTAS